MIRGRSLRSFKIILVTCCVILFLVLLFRLSDQSQMLSMFPLDYTNDWASYLAQLFFLKSCGFHSECPYWFNGFVTFQLSSPMWFFAVYPIYLLTDDVLFTAYFSLILIYCLFFLLFVLYGRTIHLSRLESVAFFAFFLSNAIAIGNFVRLGRVHEFFGLFFLVTLFFILIKYKSKELDRYFFLSLPVSAIAFLSHQTTAIFVSIFFFWFCLIRRRLQEKALAFVCFLSMLATTSFWWIPYLGNFSDSYGAGVVLTNMLFSLEADYILQTVITSLLCLMVIFFFATYIRTNRLSLRDEFVFYFPLLLLAVLVFFRAVVFLPVLKHLSPDSYNYIFIFFSTYFFLRTNFRLLSYWLYSLMVPLILIASFTSVIVSVYYTPLFQPHTAVDVFTLDALEHTSGSFLIYFIPGGASYDKAYYSYAPIYLNLTTSYGWYSVPPKDYKNLIEKEIGPAIKVGDCNNIAALLRQAEASEVVTFNSHCTTLNSCGFVIRYSNEIACVYSVSQ